MDAVIKVYCVHTEPNYSLPWQVRHSAPHSSTAVMIMTLTAAACILISASTYNCNQNRLSVTLPLPTKGSTCFCYCLSLQPPMFCCLTVSFAPPVFTPSFTPHLVCCAPSPQRKRQYTSTSTGFVAAGGERWLLTNAHSVDYHTQVRPEGLG